MVSKHLSISKVLNPENQEEDDFTNTENKPRTPFSLELAKQHLKKLAYQLQKDGRDSLAATLTTSEIELKDQFLLEFKVSNTIQKNSLDQYRNEIVSFLRRELKNWGTDIGSEVIEKDNSEDIQLMTSVDKFKKMSEKNPNLLALQKRFKLDIDF
ncbi:MAG: hypothetical protein R2799_09615 [Crocinitomicaceae bacterium]